MGGGDASNDGTPGDGPPSDGAPPKDVPGRFSIALTPGPHAVVIPETSRFQHLEILGSSGTGKNYHGLLPMIQQDIARGAGVVVIDPKGAMRRAVTAYAHAAGRDAELRILDLADPGSSDGYNPFVGDDPALVAERAHAAFYSGDATPTPFYREGARNLFLLFFSLCRRLESLPTPAQLRSVALDQAALARFAGLAPRSREARELRRTLLRQPPAEYVRNMMGLVNALTPLCSGAFAPLLNTARPAIDLGDLLAQGGILYAGLASDQYPAVFRRVSTLLLMDLQSSMTRRYGSSGAPAFLYLDEFADLVYPEVRALIAKAREARVGVTLAHQSLDDLALHGRAIASSIFENTSNKVLLRIGAAESAEVLARLSGTRRGEDTRLSHSLQIRGLGGARIPRGSGPALAHEYHFHPNDLMNLAVGEAFMVVQRHGGRELYRGRLNTAMDLPPSLGPFPARAPGPERKPLLLEDDEAEAPASLMPEPSTPLAKAALARMRRTKP